MALEFKVSVKGAVSVYGLQRFPVTLYREQWEKLLAQSAELSQFITANAGRLASKDKPGAKPRWRELEEQEEQKAAEEVLAGLATP